LLPEPLASFYFISDLWTLLLQVDAVGDTMDVLENHELCSWCGDGGDLVCCDSCPRSFCYDCLTRNLGYDKLESILSASSWICVACDSLPIEALRGHCAKSLDESSGTVTIDQSQLFSSSLNESDSVITGLSPGQRQLVDALLLVESELDEAANIFEDSSLRRLMQSMRDEIKLAQPDLIDAMLDVAVENELGHLEDVWNDRYLALQELAACYQDSAQSMGVSLCAVYEHWSSFWLSKRSPFHPKLHVRNSSLLNDIGLEFSIFYHYFSTALIAFFPLWVFQGEIVMMICVVTDFSEMSIAKTQIGSSKPSTPCKLNGAPSRKQELLECQIATRCIHGGVCTMRSVP
jgi:hypothetical protein